MESVLVHEGESAEHVSRAFAAKYGLSESVEFALREQIVQSIMSKSNLMESTERSRSNTNISRENVPTSDEEDHPHAQLSTVKILE